MSDEEYKRIAMQAILSELAEFLEWVVQAQEYVPMNDGAKKVVETVIDIQKDWKARLEVT